MATAILAVVVLGAVSFGLPIVAVWVAVDKINTLQARIEDLARVYGTNLAAIAADTAGTADEVVKIADVLTKASQIRTAKHESVFDGDKIQEKPAGARYVPIARRRAAAEAASLGPATHDDRVREANARAMETAG